MSTPAPTLPYKRARFATRLPLGRLYTPSHYWLDESTPEDWRVGFTKFATRMLGDFVEYRFELPAGSPVILGQSVGWVEGFKAVSEVFSVVSGEFAGVNPDLEHDVTLVDSDPYGRGWLYRARGRPDPSGVDAPGYATLLDATIDRMLEKSGEEREKGDG
ncbi:MAG TPA: glycine cleavage system protein H [Vicinamibacteria bacterium]|nr:glycine cleavage system protein H [Vicinamibacteria bacterium]